jgi:hypothetical protein
VIRLAVENSPVEAAWAAFDAAALALHQIYAAVDPFDPIFGDTTDGRRLRMSKAQEVARLWEEWRALYLAESDPRPAA